jgi:hypothetical protein
MAGFVSWPYAGRQRSSNAAISKTVLVLLINTAVFTGFIELPITCD